LEIFMTLAEEANMDSLRARVRGRRYSNTNWAVYGSG
jgi:hypothetical protein